MFPLLQEMLTGNAFYLIYFLKVKLPDFSYKTDIFEVKKKPFF